MQVIVLYIVIAHVQTNIEILSLQLFRYIPIDLQINVVLAVGRVHSGHGNTIAYTAGIMVIDNPMATVACCKRERLAVVRVRYNTRSRVHQRVRVTDTACCATVVIRLACSSERHYTMHRGRTTGSARCLAIP